MANSIYPKATKSAFSGEANINLIADAVKVVLVDTDAYSFDVVDQFLSDIPGGARISITGALTGKSMADDGYFHSDNPRFEGVTGAEAEAVVFFIDTGVAATSRLIFYIDTDVTGLPVTPAGASYNLIKPAAGWFKL